MSAQQAATADILRAISESYSDAKPVFDAIVAHAAPLCDAHFAFVMLHEAGRLRLAARTACTEEFARYLASGIDVNRGTTSGRAAMKLKPVQILDFLADPEAVVKPAHRSENVRTILAVPLVRGRTLLGVITLWRHEVRRFSREQVGLLSTFADQAVIAIENARLFDTIVEKSRQLELANTYKSRFLAAASHDLRQPLHALNLFAAQLRTAADPNERDRLAIQIGAAIGSMNELFDALLDMSKLDAGALEPNITEFAVADILQRLETTFAEIARSKGLKLRIVPSRAWVRSDFILLERIMLNLVSNAVRYTATGAVMVGCRRRGARIQFEVRDSGRGIAPGQKQNIFREFYRVETEDARGGAGLGLGLAIVDRLSELLDHPVTVESEPGRGSRFCVSVPIARPSVAVRADVAQVVRAVDAFAGKRIVVIDDDALVLDAMRGILTSWGCDVVASACAEDALDALKRDRPDVIISDYRLGGRQTGVEAIALVRSKVGGDVPAFLMSGDTTPERLREATQSDYFFVNKPVAPITLRAMLNRLLASADTAHPAPPLRAISRRRKAESPARPRR